jgi:multiple sugar transport system ATP-binding protein
MFVAGFIGSPKMNFLTVELQGIADGRARLRLPGNATIDLMVAGARIPQGKLTLGVRPEHLGGPDNADARIVGRVRLTEHLGAETMVYADIPGGELVVRADGLTRVSRDEMLAIGISTKSCHLFDADGRAIVNGALL